MRTTLEIAELQAYAFCPEFARRTAQAPDALPAETDYRRRLRTLLVRFYSALADGELLTEAQIRRLWSTLWEIPLGGLVTRTFAKANATTFNALLTPDERLLLRGTKALHGLCSRPLHKKMTPVIVDEPFSLVLEGLTLTGRFDLVFADEAGGLWIVDWTQEALPFATQHYFAHTLLAEGLRQQTGRSARVLVDYLLVRGNVLEASPREPAETDRQLAEVTALAKALSLELIYRRIGPWCQKCLYRPDCFGIKHVAAPSARTRHRKYALPRALGD